MPNLEVLRINNNKIKNIGQELAWLKNLTVPIYKYIYMFINHLFKNKK